MLDSVKIMRRQSEIRAALSTLAGKEKPTEDETRSMDNLDAEYRTNETRYRAALIAEDGERREAGAQLETRAGGEWDALVAGFELRQVALHLDEGRAMDGRTLEVVTELRSRGGYRGTPVSWAALERRNTVAANVPNPLQTLPIIDRLFPDSVAALMGAQMIAIESGLTEWPVTTSAVTAGWQATEAGSVAGPTQFTTVDKALAPNNTLGIRMAISRRAMLQTGAGLEEAVRRDMNGAIQQALDVAIFRGAGASGEPLGVMTTPATYGITSTAVGAGATWAAFRAAVVRFMIANAAGAPGAVRLLIRPEVYARMDGALIASTAVSEWDRMLANIPAENIAMSSNALAAPVANNTNALLTTNAGGIAPIFVGMWGAVDLIRDPFSDAASGGLRLTALTTADVTVARGAQLEVLTGVSVV
ncbi:phage major capsid protein [Tabrizicola sp.]|uniref:phage major capsid protein n=1 Tax=Tabrizicola sp. TaxID=2005166 RepID=UPI00286C3AA9|nr:phage major capsid protein [Tabrizicola sp.]